MPRDLCFVVVGRDFTNIVSLRTKSEPRSGYGGSWFLAASGLPLDGGLLRPRRLADLLGMAVLRPGRATALIALLFSTRSERVALSTSVAGRALNAYFSERSSGLFPQNRLCRGVLLLPDHHSDYLRGRRRQALRTNLRKAEAAGIRCEAITDPDRALGEITEIIKGRRVQLTEDELTILAGWAEMLSGPEMTFVVARDPRGRPLAVMAAVIDDAVCLIWVAVACSHEARWALHDHLVRILITRGVRYLLAEGGGAFGALGLEANVHHYQRLLGYELRHLKPRTIRRDAATREAARVHPDLTMVTRPAHASPAECRVAESSDAVL